MVPFGRLAELATHEQQLLAGVGPHPGQQRPQVGGLLPPVAGHLVEQRSLAVDDLVMRQREDEVLEEGVEQPERQVLLVVAAVDRVLDEVLERVVHPAHVPLEAEPQPADVGGARHCRPRRRLLGHHHHAGVGSVHNLVEFPQEGDGVCVLPAAELVGHPLPVPAAVVEVEHRGDGVDAQPVHMELVEPVPGRRDQERAHLVAAEVELQRAPVGVGGPPGVAVLVEGGAVEMHEGPLVAGEVAGDPVDDDADAPPVEGVDQGPEVVG